MSEPMSKLEWRREAIYLALVGMEMCWLLALALAADAATGMLDPVRAGLALAGLILVPVYVVRGLERSEWPAWAQRAALGGALVLMYLLLVRFVVYRGYRLSDASWLNEPIRNLRDVANILPDELMLAVLVVLLWWRGWAVAHTYLSARQVLQRMALIALFIAVSTVTLGGPGIMLLLVFFGLTGSGLAKVEGVARLSGGTRSPFQLSWIGLVAGIAAGLVLAGQALIWALRAGLGVLLAALAPVLGVVLIPFGWLVQLLVDWIQSLIGEATPAPAPTGTAVPMPTLPALQVTPSPETLETVGTIKAVVIVLLVVGLFAGFAVLARLARRRASSRVADAEFARERGPGSLLSGLGDAVAGGLQRLRAALPGAPEISAFLAAVSIRRIYANLVRLAARRDFPRLAAQTPYEYQATLHQAFPGGGAEVDAITEAYVAVHYGEAPTTRAELEVIRACWQRLRALDRELGRES